MKQIKKEHSSNFRRAPSSVATGMLWATTPAPNSKSDTTPPSPSSSLYTLCRSLAVPKACSACGTGGSRVGRSRRGQGLCSATADTSVHCASLTQHPRRAESNPKGNLAINTAKDKKNPTKPTAKYSKLKQSKLNEWDLNTQKSEAPFDLFASGSLHWWQSHLLFMVLPEWTPEYVSL